MLSYRNSSNLYHASFVQTLQSDCYFHHKCQGALKVCHAGALQSVQLSENKVPTDPELPDKRNISKSKAALYHDEIALKLQNGQHGVSIYQDLVCEAQYSGGYDSIKRYVRKLRNKTPDLYARIETPPGDEAQVDFGEGAPTLSNQ